MAKNEDNGKIGSVTVVATSELGTVENETEIYLDGVIKIVNLETVSVDIDIDPGVPVGSSERELCMELASSIKAGRANI